VTGKIIDADSRSPLEFTSVGIFKKNKGVIADRTGYFSLNIPGEYDNDTLMISAVGYEPVLLVIHQFKDVFRQNNNADIIIELKKKIPILTAVKVTPTEFVRGTVGNKGKNKPITIEYEANKLHEGIIEVGTVMTIKKSPLFITEANFIINGNKNGDTIDFRVNIYNMNEGVPHINLLSEPILVRSNMKEGILSVDLKKYNIYVDDDFFMSLQWRDGLNTGSISFGGGFLGNKSFHRVDDEGEWAKAPLRLGFFAHVLYAK
jgi:hypothetical protein